MMPMHGDPQLAEWYRDEAAKTGFEGGYVMRPSGPTFVHVAHDPGRARGPRSARTCCDEAQTYAAIQTGGQHSAPMVTAETLDELRASPQVLVGTPDDVLAAARARSRRAARSRSTRSRAGCRPRSRGRAWSCSRPRCCRGCSDGA